MDIYGERCAAFHRCMEGANWRQAERSIRTLDPQASKMLAGLISERKQQVFLNGASIGEARRYSRAIAWRRAWWEPAGFSFSARSIGVLACAHAVSGRTFLTN